MAICTFGCYQAPLSRAGQLEGDAPMLRSSTFAEATADVSSYAGRSRYYRRTLD